ncbi:MAG: BON domain-containing protein [Candidatus Rokuibacteriota bacterium]
MRILASLGSIVGTALLLSGCSSFSDLSPGQLVNDMTMTTSVKSRLATAEGMGSLTGVHVRTDNDMVYLTGTVTDDAARARIDKLVRNVAGDNRVTNQLEIEDGTSAARTR